MGTGSSATTNQLQNTWQNASQNSSNNTSSNSATNPWSAQAPYLTSAFNDAQNQYNASTASGPYSGNYVAPETGQQASMNNAAVGYASPTGVGTTAANGQVTTGNGLSGLGMAESGVAGGGLAGMTGNQTGNNINTANEVEQGFNIPGAVQSAMQAANTEAADSQLPSLYRGAAAGGNINSDRTADQTGAIEGQLANTAANTEANLQNSVYQTGLSQANTQNSQQEQALAALGALGNSASTTGNTATTSGINNALNVNTAGQTGANANYAGDQNTITNALDQFNGNNNYGWQQLGNLMNIIGGQSWGSSTSGNTSGTSSGTSSSNGTTVGNSTTQQNPSLMSTIGSGIGILGSLI